MMFNPIKPFIASAKDNLTQRYFLGIGLGHRTSIHAIKGLSPLNQDVIVCKALFTSCKKPFTRVQGVSPWTIRLIIIACVGALAGYFLAQDNTLGFIAMILTGIIVLRISEKIIGRTIYDERDKFIAVTASYATLMAVFVSVAVLVIVNAISDVLGVCWLYSLTQSIVDSFAPFILYTMVVYIISWMMLKLKYS